MPLYTFELRDGSSGIADTVGVQLADRDQALSYACDVVHELMIACERQTRTWRLDVYEDHDRRVFQIPFARLDETLDHLRPHWRTQIEDLCDRSRSLREVHTAASMTVRESRALVARSRGKPYLAVDRGQQVIRETPAESFGQKVAAQGR
jgi:hypothetical protein